MKITEWYYFTWLPFMDDFGNLIDPMEDDMSIITWRARTHVLLEELFA